MENDFGTSEYVILRNLELGSANSRSMNAGATRSITLGSGDGMPSIGVSSTEAIELSHESLSKQDRSDLMRDPRTLAVAEAMPMKLVTPMDAEPTDAAVSDGTAWGVQAVGALTTPFTGEGITVAVLDTGIDSSHEAFPSTQIELIQKDFTGQGNGDLNGHGTHCAGTIFGRDVDGTRIGVAPGVKRALIGKVLGSSGGSSLAISDAIQWALRNGANVISMSLGIDFPGFVKRMIDNDAPEEFATSRALEAYRANTNLFDSLAALVKSAGVMAEGCVLVGASGNESQRPQYEIAVAPPAAADGIIAVGAVGQTDGGLTVARFANTQVDVVAPGVGVRSARVGGGLNDLSGTSMATPHVAGVAALFAQRSVVTTGRVRADMVTSQVRGLTTRDTLTPLPFDYEDFGDGLVQAPQQ